MKNEPPIFTKWVDILKWILQMTEKFPKKVRFTFSTRIDNMALDILELIIEASYKKDKLPELNKCNLLVDKLRVLFRICFDLKYLSQKQYEYISEQLVETGLQLGGWKKQAGQK